MDEHSYRSSVFMLNDVLSHHVALKRGIGPCHHKFVGPHKAISFCSP